MMLMKVAMQYAPMSVLLFIMLVLGLIGSYTCEKDPPKQVGYPKKMIKGKHTVTIDLNGCDYFYEVKMPHVIIIRKSGRAETEKAAADYIAAYEHYWDKYKEIK
jgi:hypothetical protein